MVCKEKMGIILNDNNKFSILLAKPIPQSDREKVINVIVFNEDLLEEHQMKVILVNRLYNGFRGNKEHTYLLVLQIYASNFDNQHDCHFYNGFIGIRNLKDNMKVLSLKNVYLYLENNDLRILVINIDDPADVGITIARYMTKLHLE